MIKPFAVKILNCFKEVRKIAFDNLSYSLFYLCIWLCKNYTPSNTESKLLTIYFLKQPGSKINLNSLTLSMNELCQDPFHWSFFL